MKCQVCQTNEASLRVQQVMDGRVREMTVCPDCAAKNGLNVQCPVPILTNLLFGSGKSPETVVPDTDKTCPKCHMHYADFRKASLLGCSSCYEAFAAELEVLIGPIHESDRHCGKVPAVERAAADMNRLKTGLSEAVAAQHFEKAAELRDRLRDLMGAPNERMRRAETESAAGETSADQT